VPRSAYQLYVVDDCGRSVTMLDTHNSQGNRSWYLPGDQPFTIVLESDTIRTFLILDKEGDMVIEQEDVEPPPTKKKKQKRRSRYWKNRPPEYVPGRRSR
jgi:hypothetical protein